MKTSISVVGLGEVGLLFCALFAESELFEIRGVDRAPGQRGIVESGVRSKGRGYAVADILVSSEYCTADVHVICVDTPLDEQTHTANLANLVSACLSIAQVLRPLDSVIVRSTVPMGTCGSVVLSTLCEQSGLEPGKFFLICAPERSSSGGSLEDSQNLTHLIGGIDSASTKRAMKLFDEAGLHAIAVESIEAAELGKLASNAARDVYQALANQFAAICSEWNIDAGMLIDAINQNYPRDKINRPSPGIGGSCLTKDPYFLMSALPESERATSLFAAARNVNDHAIEREVINFSNFIASRPLGALRVLVCGIAFKGHPETWDTRNSVSVRFSDRVRDENPGLTIYGYDPVVDSAVIEALGMASVGPEWSTQIWDAIFLFSNHKSMHDLPTRLSIVSSLKRKGYIYDPHEYFIEDFRGLNTSITYRTISKRWQ